MNRTHTRSSDVAPVDAAETVVILATLGLGLLFFGVLTLVQGSALIPSVGTVPLLVIGGVCLVGALVVRALGGQK